MRKLKKEVPMVIIDTRSKGMKPMHDQRLTSQAPFQKEDVFPIILVILQKLVASIQGLFSRLKASFFNGIKDFLFQKRIPWFQVGLVLLTGFVLLQKDVQFNFALKAPVGIFTDDDNDDSTTGDMVQSVSLKNPHAPLSASMLHDKKAKAFIKKYATIAQNEMNEHGIPASIKMAQALIESRAGTSMLAVNNNNFFGMKCFSKNCRKGHCSNATDDHHKDFFRKYKTDSESWQSHSRLLSNNRYKGLRKYKGDYKKWAKGLKKAGYATDKKYDKKLIRTIEKYKLYQLDNF